MRNIVFALKPIIAGGILWYLFQKGGITLPSLEKGLNNPFPLFIASFIIFLSLLTGATRWWLLLGSQGSRIPYLRILRINMIGAFATNFMPTGIGGDAFRLFYICGEAQNKKAIVATTVFVDRFVGLLALTILVLGSTAVAINIMPDNTILLSLVSQIGSTLGIFLIIAFVAIYCIMKTTQNQIISRLIPWRKLQPLILSFFTAIRTYRGKPGIIAFSVFLSLAIHTLTIFAIILVGQMLIPDVMPLWGYFFAAPLSMIANQLPLTPGGIGIAELSFDQICRIIVPQSEVGFAIIFLTFRLLFIIISLPGGIIWLFHKKPTKSEITFS